MFSQSADQPAPDQSPAPVGMRELPPQPAKPVMPAYTLPTSAPATDEPATGSDDSVVAADDHLEGTFTSRGTVRVYGSVKGRIEAVRVRIEEGAHVNADVIVDEAIVAGEFTGNLTCRERLEARPTGHISGRVETFRLMLHEGASVEGEMHMLSESAADPGGTIRGTAPIRGETATPASEAPGDRAGAASPAPRSGVSAATPVASTSSSVDAMSTATAKAVVAQLASRPEASVTLESSAPAVRVMPRVTSATGAGSAPRNGTGSGSGF